MNIKIQKIYQNLKIKLKKNSNCEKMLEQNFENRNILNHGGGRNAVANPFREAPSYTQHPPQERQVMQQA